MTNGGTSPSAPANGRLLAAVTSLPHAAMVIGKRELTRHGTFYPRGPKETEARCLQDGEGADRGETMLRDLYVVVFSIATGFTVSGILANICQLLFPKAEGGFARTAHIGVMVFAGPSVLFGTSFKAMREQKSSRGTFWFAAIVSGYWSLVLGMVVLRILFAL